MARTQSQSPLTTRPGIGNVNPVAKAKVTKTVVKMPMQPAPKGNPMPPMRGGNKKKGK